jgi:hypothetical protein
MASDSQFDLVCNRHRREAVRFTDSDETGEAFSQREQCCCQNNRDNLLLNAKSQSVKKELAKRRWALMYLEHLANRVNQIYRVSIQFSDLLSIASLLLHDSESSSSISLSELLLYKASIEQHIEVLEHRRRDAQIDEDTSWAALDTLARGLTLRKSNLLCLWR